MSPSAARLVRAASIKGPLGWARVEAQPKVSPAREARWDHGARASFAEP